MSTITINNLQDDFKKRILFRVKFLKASQSEYIQNLILEDLGYEDCCEFFKREQWLSQRDLLGWNDKEYWTKTDEPKTLSIRIDNDLKKRLKIDRDLLERKMINDYVVNLIRTDLSEDIPYNKKNYFYSADVPRVKNVEFSIPLDLRTVVEYRTITLGMTLQDYIVNLIKENVYGEDFGNALEREKWSEERSQYVDMIPTDLKTKSKYLGIKLPYELYLLVNNIVITKDIRIKEYVTTLIKKDLGYDGISDEPTQEQDFTM